MTITTDRARDAARPPALPSSADAVSAPERRSGAFRTARAHRRYWWIVGGLLVLALVTSFGLVWWENPMPIDHPGFWRIARRRSITVVVLLIVAVCQALATVSFQTVTNNRIITPSIMGFESLYRAVQTTMVYLFGVAGLVSLSNLQGFVLQVALMVGMACALYGWLLTGRHANLQVMLLVGIIIGTGLGAVASFMQRMLTPSDFDVLTARMFGSVGNADPAYFPVAIPLMVVAGGVLLVGARTLNAVALGRETATSLGVPHRRTLITVLVASATLIAVSTALAGPMTFLGFLVATLSYQFADTHDHRYLLPMSVLVGFTVLATAYFVMHHVFYAYGVVSILIELVGGTLFLIVILKKGRL